VLKRNAILLDGSEWYIVEPGDAFTVTPAFWIGGAATMTDDWMLFVSNATVSKWVYLRDCSPVTADAEIGEDEIGEDKIGELWRNDLRETLDTFYGYKFRNGTSNHVREE